MITKKENFLQVLKGGKPEWIPVECFKYPEYGDGSYSLIPYNGSLPSTEGGQDIWGITWQGSGEFLPYIVKHRVSNLKELLDMEFPDISSPDMWTVSRDQIAQIREEKASVAWHVSSLWERLWYLLGMEKALLALYDEVQLVAAALDKILEWQLTVADHFIGIGVEAARISDDYGTQLNLMMSPNIWRHLIFPRLKILVEHYQNAGIPVALHSCGNLCKIMDDLISLNIAAFNIQTNANDLRAYRERYGSRFRLWGGISTQDVLAGGDFHRIETAVKEVVELFGQNGTLILEPDQLITIPEKSLQAYYEITRRIRHLR